MSLLTGITVTQVTYMGLIPTASVCFTHIHPLAGLFQHVRIYRKFSPDDVFLFLLLSRNLLLFKNLLEISD